MTLLVDILRFTNWLLWTLLLITECHRALSDSKNRRFNKSALIGLVIVPLYFGYQLFFRDGVVSRFEIVVANIGLIFVAAGLLRVNEEEGE